MKKILFLTILLGLANLTFAQKFVYIGKRQKFFLSDNEQTIALDKNIVKKYSVLDPDTIHQVPLQVYIKSDDYETFIGLAIYDSPQSIYNYYLTNTDYNILQQELVQTKKLSYYKILSKFNGQYNLKFIFVTKKSYFTVVVNYLSYNREILTHFFNDEKFIFAKLKIKYKK